MELHYKIRAEHHITTNTLDDGKHKKGKRVHEVDRGQSTLPHPHPSTPETSTLQPAAEWAAPRRSSTERKEEVIKTTVILQRTKSQSLTDKQWDDAE